MTHTESPQSTNKLWPRSTSLLLIIVGLVLSITSFAAVISMGEVSWHGARDAELRATYEAYQDTGVLLIKQTGSGSYGTQAPAPGPLSAAAWDDDPGAYIVASLFGHVTGSDSPYPGLSLAQGLLVALPLLWLPIAVARTFRSVRAGYALILLPVLLWLVNHGAVLVGTEYGLSDAVSTLRVYAVYGIAASMAFFSLSLLLLLSTFRLKLGVLIGISVAFGVLSGFGNLSRSLSGMGIAVCVGVLWWLNSSKRWRLVMGALASIAVVAIAVLVQSGVMGVINTARVEATGQTIQELPDAHALWHSMYLGLSYPEPITGVPSKFDVTWSDEYGWEKAREVDPDVVVASESYDSILKGLYWDQVMSDPVGALKLYAHKALFVAGHFSAMIAFIVAGFVLAFLRKGRQRRSLVVAAVIVLPTLVLGLAPPVLVMPLLYYYSELSAALGLLAAIALGGAVWSLSSLPSRVRSAERKRLAGRHPVESPISSAMAISVIVAGWDDQAATDERLNVFVATLAAELSSNDELIVVGGKPADEQAPLGQALSDGWAHPCQLVVLQSSLGVGESLRTGALASRGKRLLLVADATSVAASDLRTIMQSPDDSLVTIGSLDEPDTVRRGIRARLVTFLREGILPPGTPQNPVVVWADGDWGRSFARLSRETGALWMTELAVAAEYQGIEVRTLALHPYQVGAADARALHAPRIWHLLVGLGRVAFYKEEYAIASAEVPRRGLDEGARTQTIQT